MKPTKSNKEKKAEYLITQFMGRELTEEERRKLLGIDSSNTSSANASTLTGKGTTSLKKGERTVGSIPR